jgi:protein gp37
MNETEILWTQLTWNPASGCTKVSAGCKYCYAENLAENKRGTLAFPVGFDVVCKPHKLGEPAKVKKPSLIFTNSMTDMFHEDIPDSYRDRIIEAMKAASWHRYQVLTKRPEVAAKYFDKRSIPDCMWLGVTIEHQLTVERLAVLRCIPASVRFISAEPLLGPLDLNLTYIDWLIIGGESGSHMMDPTIADIRGLARKNQKGKWEANPEHTEWVRSLRDQCVAAGVPMFFKQFGGSRPTSAGRLLDGRTWDEMPTKPGAMPATYVHKKLDGVGRLKALEVHA